MTNLLDLNNLSKENIDKQIQLLVPFSERDSLISISKTLIQCMDMTSLKEEDTPFSIKEFCSLAKKMRSSSLDFEPISSVCVFPKFVKLVRSELHNSGIYTASVAGNFPSGNEELQKKADEVKLALDSGAQEIDYVIYKPYIVTGQFDKLYDEIRRVKDICEDVCLKIILETGEIADPKIVYKSSQVSMEAGADFIKTSTGKTPIGATPQSVYSMIVAIHDFYKSHQRKIGLKISGGISTINQTVMYYQLIKNTLSDEWLHKNLFRIGTSKLAEEMFKSIEL